MSNLKTQSIKINDRPLNGNREAEHTYNPTYDNHTLSLKHYLNDQVHQSITLLNKEEIENLYSFLKNIVEKEGV